MLWRQALAQARDELRRAGIESPALDARLLTAHAFGTDATGLLLRADDMVDEAAAQRLAVLLRRRVAREPVGRILGTREFWGLPFRLSPDTLEPRPDTETVVEAALHALGQRSRPLKLLDLGTGSGCLLVALLHELSHATGIGIDRSIGAAGTARANAVANGVGARAAFICGHWADAVEERFDLVVSNPPYIAHRIVAGLAPEVVGHDPSLALDGGDDGLDAYRAILTDLPRRLAPHGVAVLEIGYDQEDALRALADSSGMAVQDVRRDLGGQPRAVTLGPRQALA